MISGLMPKVFPVTDAHQTIRYEKNAIQRMEPTNVTMKYLRLFFSANQKSINEYNQSNEAHENKVITGRRTSGKDMYSKMVIGNKST